MRDSQHGLSSVALLIVMAVAIVVAYFAYQSILGGEEAQTCKGTFNSCMQSCRRTATDDRAEQACQNDCTRKRETCEQVKPRGQG